MGLDGLGSSAYGPEAALTALIPLGAAGLSLIGWVMAPILGLLGIPWHLKQPEIEQGLEEDDEASLPAELTRV